MIQIKKSDQQSNEIGLLVAMLRFASVISRPMRDGVADPAGFSSNELRILMALSGEGESAGHDLARVRPEDVRQHAGAGLPHPGLRRHRVEHARA